jgi:hypothetical protein
MVERDRHVREGTKARPVQTPVQTSDRADPDLSTQRGGRVRRRRLLGTGWGRARVGGGA